MARKPVVSGLNDVTRNIKKTMSSYQQATLAALYEAGHHINAQAQELVPVSGGQMHRSRLESGGQLKGSRDVSQPTANDPECRITYGDTATAYAAYQHRGERRDGTHKVRRYSVPGKQKHYLIEPATREVSTWPAGLAKRVADIKARTP